jgi:hypothetical protein
LAPAAQLSGEIQENLRRRLSCSACFLSLPGGAMHVCS